MSRISAPSATIRRACSIARIGSRKRPPSEKESGVTLRTPITIGRPSPNRRASGWLASLPTLAGCEMVCRARLTKVPLRRAGEECQAAPPPFPLRTPARRMAPSGSRFNTAIACPDARDVNVLSRATGFALDLAVAGQDTWIFLAEGDHLRPHVRAGCLARLSGSDRAIRTRSARWNDLLVGPVGDRAPTLVFSGDAGFDDIPLAATHRCAAYDWRDGARVYGRA